MTSTQINQKLRRLANASGRSQVDLASASKCSQATISAWLSGRQQLGDEIAIRLAKALGYRLTVNWELEKWPS